MPNAGNWPRSRRAWNCRRSTASMASSHCRLDVHHRVRVVKTMLELRSGKQQVGSF